MVAWTTLLSIIAVKELLLCQFQGEQGKGNLRLFQSKTDLVR